MSAAVGMCPTQGQPPSSVMKDNLIDHGRLLSQLDILDTVGKLVRIFETKRALQI